MSAAEILSLQAWLVDSRQLQSSWTDHFQPAAFVRLSDCPPDSQLTCLPPFPLIGIQSAGHPLAAALDALVEPPVSAQGLIRQISKTPKAAAAAVQLLRSLEGIEAIQALPLESMCYAMLQGSAEHAAWLAARTDRGSPAPTGRLVVERRGPDLHLTLDRVSARNAIDRALRDQLNDAFCLATLDREVRCVKLSAAGEAFSIGGDLQEFGTTRDPTTAHLIRSRTLPAAAIAGCPARLEVHVQGACIGAGLEIAAFASRLSAEPDAWFQLPELAMGLIPGAGGCISVSARIGRQRTALMILSGRRLSATTALQWGLIDAIESRVRCRTDGCDSAAAVRQLSHEYQDDRRSRDKLTPERPTTQRTACQLTMRHQRLRAVFMRGGTSKAVMFRREDLPPDPKQWDDIFLQVMGSPDPNGRQLDGMGGGLSSLSKVCVVGPSNRPDADVDYTFAQVGIDTALVDYGGNCGNMSGAIGPFAVEEGIVPAPADGEAVVRIHNTNTSKIIVSRFPMVGGALAAEGELEIDGVAGRSAPVRLEFVEPGGAKTGVLLPTREPRDLLDVAGVGRIAASCIDAANPCVFVAAEDVGKTGAELPEELERDAAFLEKMESIRRVASVRMGLTADLDAAGRLASIPKVAMVCAPQTSPTLSGRTLSATQIDLGIRMMSVGQPHRAVPITGAVCVAVAARIPGTIPHRFCRSESGPLRIGHPSGTTVVDAAVIPAADGSFDARYGAVYRSARRLFEGNVVYRGP